KDIKEDSEDNLEAQIDEKIEKMLFINIQSDLPVKAIIDLSDYKTVYLSFHHIAVDGFSIGVLTEEIINLIQNITSIDSIKVEENQKYFNFIELQSKQDFSKHLSFFKNQLKDLSDIPSSIDSKRNKIENFDAEILYFDIDFEHNDFDHV